MNLPVLMSRDLEAGESTGYPCGLPLVRFRGLQNAPVRLDHGTVHFRELISGPGGNLRLPQPAVMAFEDNRAGVGRLAVPLRRVRGTTRLERMEEGIVPGALESGMEPEANGCRYHKLKHCDRENRREETFCSLQQPEARIGLSRSLPVHTAGMTPERRHRPETAQVQGR